jgi:3',5'-cyclic AMP phosphodiesterase CpdA
MISFFMHLSDPHFGTERPEVVDALSRFVKAQAPPLVVLSGDITQRARREQFQRAGGFLASLAVPRVLVIPGNHDIPLFNLAARLLRPYANHRRQFGPELEPVLDAPGLLMLGVNTTRWYRWKDGEVSARQIERVSQRLARAHPSQLRVVVTHQPVAVDQASEQPNLLHGHRAAVAAWSRAGADLVLGGHIHLPFVLPLHERQALPRRLWAVQAGTALSSRIRHEAGNSVNLVRWSASDGAVRHGAVERWDYAEGAQVFQRVAAHALDLVPAFAG